MRRAGGDRGLAGLVALALVVAALGGGVTAVSAGPVQGDVLQQATPDVGNETTRHEHPDRAGGSQDLPSVRGWLADRMAARLSECAVEVGLNETVDACSFSEQYPDWLSKYVDVAGVTDEDGDDRRAEVFNETRQDHEDYGESVSAFRETYREYQRARAAGNDQRARELARELQRQADHVHENGGELLVAYGVIETGDTTVDLQPAKDGVNATLENVSETVETVEEAEFIPTVLTAQLSPEQISFTTPGTVTGRLTTENGTPLVNRTVRLVVADRTYETSLDSTGRFSVEYRPVTLPASVETLTVRYRSRNASTYLGSNVTVPVSVNQVEPDVAVSVEPTPARFGDEVRVSGRVAADGVGAPGVPVVVTVDGRQIDRVATDSSGRFSAAGVIGANDGPGELAVRARLALEGRALATTMGTSALAVESTATTLTVEPSSPAARAVTVSGRLTTVEGLPVADQPVELLVNGTAVGTVRTDEDGRYETRLSVPGSLVVEGEPSNVAVTGRFDGSETNLESVEALTTVSLPAGTTGDQVANLIKSVVSDVQRLPLWLHIVFGLLAGLGLIVSLLRLWRWWRAGGEGANITTVRSDTGTDGSSERAPEAAETISRLDRARESLDTDADGAVLLAYAAVREALTRTGHLGRRDADTHWEFLAACRQDGLSADAIEGLTQLTEAYERAAYAEAGLSREEAAAAVSGVEGLVST